METFYDERRRRAGVSVEHNGQSYEIEIRYDLGGMNYFAGKVEPRGYRVSVTPVEYEQCDGYRMKKFTAFSGKAMIVEPAERFTKSKFEKIVRNPQTLEKAKMIFDKFGIPIPVLSF